MSQSAGGTLSNDSIYFVLATFKLNLLIHNLNSASLITQGTGSNLLYRNAVNLALDELVDQMESALDIDALLKGAKLS